MEQADSMAASMAAEPGGSRAVDAVDFDALARQVARTDWDYEFSDDMRVYRNGAAQVEATLEAIGRAASLDPDGVTELVDRFADKNPRRGDIVQVLRGAADAPIALDPPAVDIGALPVFRPSPTDIVDRRESFTLDIDQTVRVLGRTNDGERVFARNGGGVLSISRDAFNEAPTLGQTLTVSKIDGQVRAVPTPELALER